MFVTYLNSQNQIPVYDALLALLCILTLVLIASFVLHQRDKKSALDAEFLTPETGLLLRGFAVLLLILGHFWQFCVEGDHFFDEAGTWAVTIFLFISGIALIKTYGFTGLEKTFLLKRIRRVLPATWIALIVFYLLDLVLRKETHSATKIALNFLGIITPNPPNSPAWFITYILYLYLLYYWVSKIPLKNAGRVTLLLALSYGTTWIISNFPSLTSVTVMGLWIRHTIVFPIAVAVGLYSKEMKRALDLFFKRARSLYLLTLCICLSLYCSGIGIYKLSHLINSEIYTYLVITLQPIPMIIALVMISSLIDTLGVSSKFLIWLGRYSFEIFLIHLPFMVYYDFILFRKPLYLFFLLYLCFVFALSYSLEKASALFDTLFFGTKRSLT